MEKEVDKKFPDTFFTDEWLRADERTGKYMPGDRLFVDLDVDPTQREFIREYVTDQVYAYIYMTSGSNTETLKRIIQLGFRRGISTCEFRNEFADCMKKAIALYMRTGDVNIKKFADEINNPPPRPQTAVDSMSRNLAQQIITILEKLGLAWSGSYDRMLMRGIFW